MKKLYLVFVFVLCCFLVFSQKIQPDKSLVAYFPFNGNAKDLSSSKLNVRVFGAMMTGGIAGNPNGAYYFNGINAFIEVQNSPSINLTDSFTISCWIAPESKFDQVAWISKANRYSQWQFGFGEVGSNEWGISHYNKDKAAYFTTVDSIPLKQWSFVAVSYSKKDNKISFYKNGKLMEEIETVSDFSPSNLPLYIGYQKDESLLFNGNIDEVKIFNKPLNEKQINDLYKEFSDKVSSPVFLKKDNTYTSPTGLKDYFNQTEPGNTAIRFAPGFFGPNDNENSAPAFSPDKREVYWSVIVNDKDSVYQEIRYSEKIGEKWTEPQRAPFSTGKMYEGCPVISADGNKLFLYRGMPLFRYGFPANCKIIYYTKVNNEWTNPQVITDGVYPSVSKDGTLYYNSRSSRIIRIPFKDGKYGQTDTLKNITFPQGRSTMPLIAPDESFMIFNRRNSSEIFGDFYMTFYDKLKNTWSTPMPVEQVNTDLAEVMPGLSPDLKYFFFVRTTPDHSPDIFWTNTGFINELKKQVQQKEKK